MKKLFSMILITVMLMSILPVSAYDATYLGDTYYTDIVTYINHYPIPSYNFNGATLVAAEDLSHYGFYVYWNEYNNTLTINRDKSKNGIDPLLTFRPTEQMLGTKELEITSTDVRVYTGDYRYLAYGGIYGKTLINVNGLTSINKVKVNWHPEINAVKIWVEDGLTMSYAPFEVRRFDPFYEYYESCYNLGTTQIHTNYECSSENLLLTFTEIDKATGICTGCYTYIKITDILDSYGQSVLKNRFLYISGYPTLAPYCYGFSDYYLAHSLFIYPDDLYTTTASDPGGLIKYEYTCGGSTYYGTIKVPQLPSSKPTFSGGSGTYL